MPSQKDVALQEIQAPPAQGPSVPAVPRRDPLEVLLTVIEEGRDLEYVKTLMDLQERWEKTSARKAFDAAISAAKAEMPVIAKNRHVGFKAKKEGAAKTDYWHEDLAEIARTIDPVLGKHGLSYRFRTKNAPNEPIVVTCILSHRDGHYEENTLSGGRDDTGNKNSLQQVGSTITYLQRYTLKAALGLSASKDDDGAASEGDEGGTITPEQVTALRTRITTLKAKEAKLLNLFGVEKLEDMRADAYAAANAELDELQNVREAQAREKAGA